MCFNFPEDLIFEETTYGLRFGDGKTMFFIPCYSVQSGYYSNEIDVLYVLYRGYVKHITCHCELKNGSRPSLFIFEVKLFYKNSKIFISEVKSTFTFF